MEHSTKFSNRSAGESAFARGQRLLKLLDDERVTHCTMCKRSKPRDTTGWSAGTSAGGSLDFLCTVCNRAGRPRSMARATSSSSMSATRQRLQRQLRNLELQLKLELQLQSRELDWKLLN